MLSTNYVYDKRQVSVMRLLLFAVDEKSYFTGRVI